MVAMGLEEVIRRSRSQVWKAACDQLRAVMMLCRDCFLVYTAPAVLGHLSRHEVYAKTLHDSATCSMQKSCSRRQDFCLLYPASLAYRHDELFLASPVRKMICRMVLGKEFHSCHFSRHTHCIWPSTSESPMLRAFKISYSATAHACAHALKRSAIMHMRIALDR
jgi:hypothetical protein